MDSDQQSLTWTEDPEIVEYDRCGDGDVGCPDCDAVVTDSKGTHEASTRQGAVRVHGWKCDQCNNVFPANCHGPDAPSFIGSVTGVVVEFRDGSREYVPVFEDSV